MAMDDLINESSLGLNIVSIPSSAPKAAPKPANKKKSKYDIRRRKAKAAREGKPQPTTALKGSNNNVVKTVQEDTDDGTADGDDRETITPEDTDNKQQHKENADEDDSSSVDSESSAPTANEDKAPQPNDSRSTLPEDDEERAKYLAEFHARPMELDRRAGAVARVPARSKDSLHLFEEASKWDNFSIHPKIVHCLQNQIKLEKPTVIQSKTIPEFFRNDQLHNILIHSETGSGKTLAYLLPILQSLAVNKSNGELDKRDRAKAGTRCIILCPTRELASQTLVVAEQVCSHTFNWIVAGCLFGEERRKSEKARIRKGLTIVVATPGRLLDHLMRTESLLMACKAKVEWLVLDEADRLLDMGLGDQVKQIVQRLRANQPGSGRDGVTWRSVLISATITSHVETLANDTLIGGDNSWVWIKGGKDVADAAAQGYANSTPHQLSQNVITVSAKLRLAALVAFLAARVKKGERSVVFMSTCAAVDFYHALFQSMSSIFSNDDAENGIFGQSCQFFKLHGSVPHGERQTILRKFGGSKDIKQAGVLLATDVAARGLNLVETDWAIQFDPPSEVSDYVHRVGRVSRAGAHGHSLLFLLPSERPFLDVLKKNGVKRMTGVSLATTLNSAALLCERVTEEGIKRAGGSLGGSFTSDMTGRRGEAFCTELQNRLEECVVLEDAATKTEAKAARKELNKGQRRAKPVAVSGTLIELARNAFVSHLRAYPTKEKSLRVIFTTKSLHYGHVARSFALKEPPTKLKTQARPPKILEDKETKKQNSKMSFDDKPDERSPKRQKREADPRQAKALLMANASKLEQQSDNF
jgi:ATP-dependent RNA helicase DDX31/DBP7